MAFSRTVGFEFDALNNAQLAKIVQGYERFLQKTKNQFYQNWFGYFVARLKQHMAGEIVLQRRQLFQEEDIAESGFSVW